MTPLPIREVLFLCTGNYYRSRFAEVLFNHLMDQRGQAWRAFSRALAIERGHANIGPISHHTRRELARLNIALPEPVALPCGVCDADYSRAVRVIALKEAEHRPLMARCWPGWCDRIEYWHVHDLDAATPEQALGEIDLLVRKLVEELIRQAAAARSDA